MLWLTGIDRYVTATLELYGSTVHPTTLFGGGWTWNIARLGEALLLGLGLLLPVLGWELRRAPVRLVQCGDRATLFALWTLPALAVFVFVHFGQHGYLLTILPAGYLLVGRALVEVGPRWMGGRALATWRSALVGVALIGALGAHVAFFTVAGPMAVPISAADASWGRRLGAELRALYRFRLWSYTAAGLREREAVIADYVSAVRREFDPRDTVLVTELGNPRSYPWFRHVMYYLPEYATYHLRLGEASPGFLSSRKLSTMAAVVEWRVPLPMTTRRLVWVVDEWHPELPRPAALKTRALAHGRSLYVLPVGSAVVEHAGYQLAPVTAVVRLR